MKVGKLLVILIQTRAAALPTRGRRLHRLRRGIPITGSSPLEMLARVLTAALLRVRGSPYRRPRERAPIAEANPRVMPVQHRETTTLIHRDRVVIPTAANGPRAETRRRPR
jgi:hypothetical protein